jgi:hypothetical protein
LLRPRRVVELTTRAKTSVTEQRQGEQREARHRMVGQA